MLAENLENLVKKEQQIGLQKGLEQGRQEGLQEGLQEGRREAKRDMARNLISRTEMDDQLIAEIAGLTVNEVSVLRSQVRH